MKFSSIDIHKFGNTIQLIGVIYGDEKTAYMMPFVEYKDDHPENAVTVDMTHEDWKALLQQSDKVEVEVLSNTKDGELFKAIVRKCERTISQQVSWNCFRRDSFKCRYCSKDDVPLTVDHAICWEAGGPSIEANLVSSCKKCNKVRGDMPYADWLQHPYYLDVYRNLTPEDRYQNELLAGRLANIPLVVNVRSR